MDRVLAVVGLRFRLTVRRARGATGLANVIGGILIGLGAGLLALGLAAGLGAATWFAADSGEEAGLRVAYLVSFYTFLFFGLALPLFTGAVRQGFDASPFRVFPVSGGRLYGITLAAYALSSEHLFYYPALLAVAVAGVVLPGIHVAAGLLAIFLLLLFFIAWGNALVLLLVSVMRRRRMREIIAIIAFLVLITAALAPSLIQDEEGGVREDALPYLAAAARTAVLVGKALPPTLAADGLASSTLGSADALRPRLAWLVLWDVAGFLVGYRIFARRIMAGAGTAHARRTPQRPSGRDQGSRRWLSLDHPAFDWIPGGVRGMAAKELRYLRRSVTGKFNIVLLPLMVIFISFVFGGTELGSIPGLPAESLVLFGLVIYASLLSSNFINNAFAWEGEGVRAYFMSPTPLRHVLAGKNLGIWIYNLLALVLTLVTWSLLQGVPQALALVTAVLIHASAMLLMTAVGNVISVLFPVRRDVSSMTSSPSQLAVLIAFASLTATVSLIGLFLLPAYLLERPLLQPVLLLVLLGALVCLYRFTLRLAAHLLEKRRERVIESLRPGAA